MDKEPYSIKLNNIKRIPFKKYEQNFTFIVDGKKYYTNRILADLLSPIICQFHYQDETITEYTINSKDKLQSISNNTTKHIDYFEDFLNLCNFEETAIDETSQKYFSQYFLQLGNYEEFFRLQPNLFDNITPENVIEQFQIILPQFYDQMNILNSNPIDKLIKFSAEHFEEIDKEKILTLQTEIIEKIIQNESLQLNSEDTLLQFIIKLYKKDNNNSYLFENVIFRNVEEKSLHCFIEEVNFYDLNIGTWKSISLKLLPSKEIQIPPKRYKEKSKKCLQFFENDGIMKHLSNENRNMNINKLGIIEISTNSYQCGYHPENLVDYQESNYYASKDEPYPFVCFDFKDKMVRVTGYSIKTYSAGNAHLKNWVLEVSNDKSTWKTIDIHSDDSTLNKKNFLATFKCNSDSFYRYIQLRTTGKSWHDSYYQYWANIDFYGEIK